MLDRARSVQQNHKLFVIEKNKKSERVLTTNCKDEVIVSFREIKLGYSTGLKGLLLVDLGTPV